MLNFQGVNYGTFDPNKHNGTSKQLMAHPVKVMAQRAMDAVEWGTLIRGIRGFKTGGLEYPP